MAVFTDQAGNTIVLEKIPQRIISLVPSQTELLYDLGLREEVVGITKFCVHPAEWFHTKPRIGGTKKIKIDLIHSLQPDLILANKEENVKEQVEELQKYYPVWISDIATLPDAYEMMEQVGRLTHKEQQATEMIGTIQQQFSTLPRMHPSIRTAYLVWQRPYMTVGGDTFIHAIMDAAGLENSFGDHIRYPTISIKELQAKDLQLLLLPSEPFPFTQKHVDQLQPLLPNTKVLLADGEMFSWYGSRLRQAAGYLKNLIELITNR